MLWATYDVSTHWYSLAVGGDSNEFAQHMFLWRNMDYHL